MKCVQAAESEIPLIRDLAYRTWPVAYGSILSTSQMEYMLEKFYSNDALKQQMHSGHIFLMAYHNHIPSGFASYAIDQEKRSSRLHKLYVLPDNQGKGLGQMLLDAVIQRVRSRADTLELNVNRHNKALHFYERNHFKVIRTEDIDIGAGYYMNDYVMELSFSDRQQ